MSTGLRDFVEACSAVDLAPEVAAFAAELAAAPGVVAVLFYGSNLRSGSLEGRLDFYRLTDGPHRRGLRGAVEARLWPEIAFVESASGLHAKVATLPLEVFAAAAAGRFVDTTIWARFVQPCALVNAADPQGAARVTDALADCATTAARFAATLGPERGDALAFWSALFRETYAAELRPEAEGREAAILAADPARWRALLPLAWEAAGIAFGCEGLMLSPRLPAREAAAIRRAWKRSRRWGRPLNALRLLKAAFVTDGAARYAAWKLERHTGQRIEVTPWRERHPILAAPAVLWRLRRRKL